jgi:hypothetical protein
MPRTLPILGLGLAGALLAYGCLYFAGTAAKREMLRDQQPELAWLKQEFNLSDTEFRRVVQQHEAYLPQCQAMCRRIEAQNAKVRQLLAAAAGLSPELESAIAEAAKLRGACQANMLRHFFAVSQTMPPAQGRRYLAWITAKTFPPERAMGPMEHEPSP